MVSLFNYDLKTSDSNDNDQLPSSIKHMSKPLSLGRWCSCEIDGLQQFCDTHQRDFVQNYLQLSPFFFEHICHLRDQVRMVEYKSLLYQQSWINNLESNNLVYLQALADPIHRAKESFLSVSLVSVFESLTDRIRDSDIAVAFPALLEKKREAMLSRLETKIIAEALGPHPRFAQVVVELYQIASKRQFVSKRNLSKAILHLTTKCSQLSGLLGVLHLMDGSIETVVLNGKEYCKALESLLSAQKNDQKLKMLLLALIPSSSIFGSIRKTSQDDIAKCPLREFWKVIYLETGLEGVTLVLERFEKVEKLDQHGWIYVIMSLIQIGSISVEDIFGLKENPLTPLDETAVLALIDFLIHRLSAG